MKPHPVNYWHIIILPFTYGLVVVTVVLVVLSIIEAERQ